MCLTAEALALFLNLLPPGIVETTPGRIIVHAEMGEAHWVANDERWCTIAPYLRRSTQEDR